MQVNKIQDEQALQQAFAIREKVFVLEQKVPKEEEYDAYEESSVHFLALDQNGKPCGTARWRFTDKGIKLERFAVLAECRGQGLGQALVSAVLDDVHRHPKAKGRDIYLHAQLSAVPLYEKFGFVKKGDQFLECEILHYLMIRK